MVQDRLVTERNIHTVRHKPIANPVRGSPITPNLIDNMGIVV